LLWYLVNPPEKGGLGMHPSEAKRLTPAEARFYLMGEDDVKNMESRMRARSARLEGKSNADMKQSVREYMAAKRKKYTGE